MLYNVTKFLKSLTLEISEKLFSNELHHLEKKFFSYIGSDSLTSENVKQNSK